MNIEINKVKDTLAPRLPSKEDLQLLQINKELISQILPGPIFPGFNDQKSASFIDKNTNEEWIIWLTYLPKEITLTVNNKDFQKENNCIDNQIISINYLINKKTYGIDKLSVDKYENGDIQRINLDIDTKTDCKQLQDCLQFIIDNPKEKPSRTDLKK